MYGQTVLARIAQCAGMEWDHDAAHSAVYDAEQTAELFCLMTNRWQVLSQLEDNGTGSGADGTQKSFFNET